MAIPVKTVVAAAAFTGVGGIGVWLAHQSGQDIFVPLAYDEAFISSGKVKSEYENKYAASYANFLIGFDGKNDV